jgi:hypothetical protein
LKKLLNKFKSIQIFQKINWVSTGFQSSKMWMTLFKHMAFKALSVAFSGSLALGAMGRGLLKLIATQGLCGDVSVVQQVAATGTTD